MTREEVARKFIKIVENQAGIDNVFEDMDLVEDRTLGFDSLDLVELIFNAEDEFDIEISDEEAERCVTVGDAIDLIHRLIA